MPRSPRQRAGRLRLASLHAVTHTLSPPPVASEPGRPRPLRRARGHRPHPTGPCLLGPDRQSGRQGCDRRQGGRRGGQGRGGRRRRGGSRRCHRRGRQGRDGAGRRRRACRPGRLARLRRRA
ncbi:hypothetical protein CKY39_07140 [Variovorax boronicumulans]|uniref:Uncharacterized protein n=1 Tax=Variovorax boronicumulans TaxID=436515 RepID=A0A250DFA1_9BURK|nr:hypothetical protein CKY39_07140 [Variovorax boronicumulans]